MYNPYLNTETMRRDAFYESCRPSWLENFILGAGFVCCVLMAFVAVWG
jgi:hypothetical protein